MSASVAGVEKATEKYHPKICKDTVKHDKKIQVWDCFAAHGVGNLYQILVSQHTPVADNSYSPLNLQ